MGEAGTWVCNAILGRRHNRRHMALTPRPENLDPRGRTACGISWGQFARPEAAQDEVTPCPSCARITSRHPLDELEAMSVPELRNAAKVTPK